MIGWRFHHESLRGKVGGSRNRVILPSNVILLSNIVVVAMDTFGASECNCLVASALRNLAIVRFRLPRAENG